MSESTISSTSSSSDEDLVTNATALEIIHDNTNNSLRRRHRHQSSGSELSSKIPQSTTNRDTYGRDKESNSNTKLAPLPLSSSQSLLHQNEDHKNNKQASQNPFLLFICASGICTCYLYYGTIQEQLFSKNSNSDMKKCGNTTTFMLVLSCFTNVLVATIWTWADQRMTSKSRSTTEKVELKHQKKDIRLNHKLFLYSKFVRIIIKDFFFFFFFAK